MIGPYRTGLMERPYGVDVKPGFFTNHPASTRVKCQNIPVMRFPEIVGLVEQNPAG
jgi:hypothetical protein